MEKEHLQNACSMVLLSGRLSFMCFDLVPYLNDDICSI